MQRTLRALHRAQHRKAGKNAADRRNRRGCAQRFARLIGLRVAQIQQLARRAEHLPDIQLVHQIALILAHAQISLHIRACRAFFFIGQQAMIARSRALAMQTAGKGNSGLKGNQIADFAYRDAAL